MFAPCGGGVGRAPPGTALLARRMAWGDAMKATPRSESRYYRDMDWDAIAKACALVAGGGVKRVDGDGWKVYQTGSVIRVDITVG